MGKVCRYISCLEIDPICYILLSREPCCEKTGFFAYAKTKTHISCTVTAQLISAFVFTIRIVRSLYYINRKFQASNHLLWLYRPVCVRPSRKPRRPVFSQRGSCIYYKIHSFYICIFYTGNNLMTYQDCILEWHIRPKLAKTHITP